MKGIIVGGINIIERDSKILLIKEKSKIVKGKWNLPGGALDVDEDIISCAKREGKEETGFELKPTYLVGIYNQILPTLKSIIISFIFKSDIVAGELILSEDVEDIKWFSFEEIKKFNEENLLAFPYVLKAIQDYKTGRKVPLNYINVFH